MFTPRGTPTVPSGDKARLPAPSGFAHQADFSTPGGAARIKETAMLKRMYYGMAAGLWTVVVHGLNYLADGGTPTKSQVVATVIAAMATVALLFLAEGR